jgi:ATP-dependent Clp protease ATP-binding subunit ClpB
MPLARQSERSRSRIAMVISTLRILTAPQARAKIVRTLTETQIRQIVEIQLDRLQARLAERHLTLTCTDTAKAYLARVGYDPAFWALPLKRAMQRELETPLARRIVRGEVRDGMHVLVDVVSDGLVFKAAEATVAA